MNDPFSGPTAMDKQLPASDPFDLEGFMNQEVEGIGSTTVTPIPAGKYFAMIGPEERDVRLASFTNKTTGEPGLQLFVTFHLIDDSGSLKAKIDREPRITHSYFLDTIIGDSGRAGLDMGKGKNVALNRLRAACGQNTGGRWAPPMLRGAGPVSIDIIVEPDKTDREVLRNRVKAVGAPARTA